ncbi:GyrI-like small molecule binding domain containing protein [Nitzschia inconspicua]|uniref:GyrI-like small molecule binding domain containing protein n=1 Tax=Nitzschia inconspicua TaxID=303405 RepID=A0A9K3PEZ7_9STRA|nr:GyrI-like small molecule binding domain containing protein [Nitzschia inconspicua]
MASTSSSASSSVFPKIISTTTQRFFGIVGHGPFDTCGPLFTKLTDIAKQQKLFSLEGVKRAMLVLCDVPTTDKEDLEWAVSLLIPEQHKTVTVPEGLEEIIVPGHARVATTLLVGPYEGLPKAWGNLVMEWIPSQGLKPITGSRQAVHYEVYVKACEDGHDPSETQLYCPVQDQDSD